MSAKRSEAHIYRLTAIFKNGHVARYEIKQVSRIHACREIIHMCASSKQDVSIKKIVDTSDADVI
jgi:hypothetical protein